MPSNTVCVCRPGKWGNPFFVHHPSSAVEKPMSSIMAVTSFRSMLAKEGGWFPVPLPWPKGKIPAQFTTFDEVRLELRGSNLACWCRLCLTHTAGKPFAIQCAEC